MRKIILASKSPRRKELLEKIGLKFDVEVSSYKESHKHDLKPEKLAEFLSLQKAKDVARKHKDAIIIAADTFVVFKKGLYLLKKLKAIFLTSSASPFALWLLN